MSFSWSVTRRLLAATCVAAAAALLVSGCSSPATPSLFPTAFGDPPPRDDTTMNPAQVKQAVDDLVSDRNHLCAVTMADQPPGAPANCTPEAAPGTAPAPAAGAATKP
jgi:hypothetical protein